LPWFTASSRYVEHELQGKADLDAVIANCLKQAVALQALPMSTSLVDRALRAHAA
jgi:hypothetical protein